MADMEINNSLYSISYLIKQEPKTQASASTPEINEASLIELDNMLLIAKAAGDDTYNQDQIKALKEEILNETYSINLNDLAEQLMVELLTNESL